MEPDLFRSHIRRLNSTRPLKTLNENFVKSTLNNPLNPDPLEVK